MCGRYASARTTVDLADILGAVDETGPELAEPDYNVAPTKPVPAAIVRHGERKLVALRWGLVPSWTKDPKIGSRLINARMETIESKPAFRAAFARRRCLLPADGFYEWAPPLAGSKAKRPFYLTPADGSVLAMAGLYEVWSDAEDRLWWTCTVITTEAADDVGHIHDRSPLTVPEQRWSDWLDPDVHGGGLLDVLVPAVAGQVTAVEVSTEVNNVRNNGPQLIEPV